VPGSTGVSWCSQTAPVGDRGADGSVMEAFVVRPRWSGGPRQAVSAGRRPRRRRHRCGRAVRRDLVCSSARSNPGEPTLPVWRRPRMAVFKPEVPRRRPPDHRSVVVRARHALKEPHHQPDEALYRDRGLSEAPPAPSSSSQASHRDSERAYGVRQRPRAAARLSRRGAGWPPPALSRPG